jgi:hypothetical protein
MMGARRQAEPAEAQEAEEAEGAAEFRCPMHPEVLATWKARCPKCGMDLEEAERGEMVMGMGRMEPEQRKRMMMRHRVMMGSELHNADPAALLALGEAIELTDEQTAELEAIAEDARTRALDVLSDEQREAVEGLPDQPRSMMQMRRHMMRRGHMGGMMGSHMGPMAPAEEKGEEAPSGHEAHH